MMTEIKAMNFQDLKEKLKRKIELTRVKKSLRRQDNKWVKRAGP
jgi:hypothetical protein